MAQKDSVRCLDDCLDQPVCGNRLVQICDATQLRRLTPDGLVIESSHEYYRKREASLLQLANQLYTGDITELDVDNKAIGVARRGDFKKSFRRIVGIRGISERR